MSKRINLNRSRLFDPSISRNEEGYASDISINNLVFKSNNDLLYEDGKPAVESIGEYSKFGRLISTNELNFDYSKFENHTFFDSAVSKTNIAFDRMVNKFPFDSTESKIEKFRESSTGFESYVYDNFPKNKGYLVFDNAQQQKISVKDMQGYLYDTSNEKNTQEPVFSPNTDGFTTEFWIYIPGAANVKQTVCQIIDSNRAGFSFDITNTSDTSSCTMTFTLLSSSNVETADHDTVMSVGNTITKGKFNHVCGTVDNINKKINFYVNGNLKESNSLIADVNRLEMRQSDLIIASGSLHKHRATSASGVTDFLPEATFTGSIDEFKFYHGAKKQPQIQNSLKKNVFKNSEKDINLISYFRFNEPTGTYTGNDLVLDYSGNSLHSKITNFNTSMRNTGSLEKCPLSNETLHDNPVLFADHSLVKNLNQELLTSGTLYDEFNPNIITKLIPKHYFLEGQMKEGLSNLTGSLGDNYSAINLPNTGKMGNTQLLISFLLIWAKFYDELKLYVDNFSKLLKVGYDDKDNAPAAFYKLIAENKGIKLPQLIDNDIDYLKFSKGINLNNQDTFSKHNLNKVQNELWKRILINAKHMFRQKGTKSAIQTLFNSFGLDFDKYFVLKEYGGPRAKYLEDLRQKDRKVVKYLDFSGSLASVDSPGTSNNSGFHASKPHLTSSYLSGSRIEVGFPEVNISNATGTVTVGNNATKAQLDAKTLTIKDSNGLQKVYIFDDDNDGATGTLDGSSNVRIQINGIADDTAGRRLMAAQIEAAIEHANGHNGSIVVVRANNILTLTQPVRLNDGNNTITTTASDATHLAVAGFTGGAGYLKSSNLPHGISFSQNDGLFTSGSFTFEGVYKFDTGLKHFTTQSLARMNLTGASVPCSTSGLIANLIAINDKKNTKIKLYARPHRSTIDSDILEMQITSASIFDGDPWYISFGRTRFDDDIVQNSSDIKITASSSYFLRCGKVGRDKNTLFYTTSSFYEDRGQAGSNGEFLGRIDNSFNQSGAFITLGSQSYTKNGNDFLNLPELDDITRASEFSGKVNFIKFWSRSATQKEARERTKNPFSLSTNNPIINFNHNTELSGAFGRLRMYNQIANQTTTASNASGELKLFDFSQNDLNLSCFGFEANKKVIKSSKINISRINYNFDDRATDDKIRVRSYNFESNLKNTLYAQKAPVFEIDEKDKVDSDQRVSIDLSIVKSLNEDIVKMFENLEVFDDYLGDPRNSFEEDYIDLEKLRDVYFNELVSKIDLSAHSKFFTWFYNGFGDLISSLIPLEAVFLGVNYVIESHVLERHKFRYYFNKQYILSNLSDDDDEQTQDLPFYST